MRARRCRAALALLAVATVLGVAILTSLAFPGGGGVADAAGAVTPGRAVADAAGAATPGRAVAVPDYLVVAEGDTLWDLVRPHTPAGRDATAYVAEVAAANGLDPQRLQPGTVVRLP